MAVNKELIIENVLKEIGNKFPNELVAKYKDMNGAFDIERLSTGSIAVDEALGGGIPKGRLIEIVGKASSGKTTLALTITAEIQKENPDAHILYLDAECALDTDYARGLGVNIDEVFLVQPSSGDKGYAIAESFINSGVMDLIIIDSIPAMIPEAMLNYEIGERPQIAVGAALDNAGVSRLFSAAAKTGCTVILINQYRERVVVGTPTQGDGISGNGYLPGGQSLPFYMSQIIKIQRVGKIYDGEEVVGDQVRMWAIKNKVGKPYTQVDFYTSYGNGISIADEIVEYGEKYGFITKTARTYAVRDLESEDPEAIVENSRKSGRQNFINWLNENPKLVFSLKKQIKDKVKEDMKKSTAAKEALLEESTMMGSK